MSVTLYWYIERYGFEIAYLKASFPEVLLLVVCSQSFSTSYHNILCNLNLFYFNSQLHKKKNKTPFET